jgi:hypothetical protein
LSVLAGGLTAAALVGTSLMAGVAVDNTAHKDNVKAMGKAAAYSAIPVRPAVAPIPHPTRTVTTTRVVPASSAGAGASGGTTIRWHHIRWHHGHVRRCSGHLRRHHEQHVRRCSGSGCCGSRWRGGARSGRRRCSCCGSARPFGRFLMTTLEVATPVRNGTASWPGLGTYVHLSTADETALEPARQIATRLLDDVDRTCSRFGRTPT